MYVKKFEGDTLEEVLKAVKSELGPDAIILKTTTNKGLKGAFKKKKIEITAAISQKNYEKKASVDKVMSPEQRNQFYLNRSEKISEAIDNYSKSPATVKVKAGPQAGSVAGYGHMGLNKMVNTLASSGQEIKNLTNKASQKIKTSLDDFLSQEDGALEQDSFDQVLSEEPPQLHLTDKEPNIESVFQSKVDKELVNELKLEIKSQDNKILLLEKRLNQLNQQIPQLLPEQQEPQGVLELKNTLKTLEIEHKTIMKLIRLAHENLTKDELENSDIVFEYVLSQMIQLIKVDQALFAKEDTRGPVVTVLLSDSNCGQTTMAKKIAVLNKDATLIHYHSDPQKSESAIVQKMFDIECYQTHALSEMLGYVRRSVDSNRSVVIDLKCNHKDFMEGKKIIDTLSRSFNRIEVLIHLSAIHSEIYNRKIVARYKDLADGLIISHVDLCLNFGAIFNVQNSAENLPLKFFGTGNIIPDDIEAATAERIMAGLFELEG